MPAQCADKIFIAVVMSLLILVHRHVLVFICVYVQALLRTKCVGQFWGVIQDCESLCESHEGKWSVKHKNDDDNNNNNSTVQWNPWWKTTLRETPSCGTTSSETFHISCKWSPDHAPPLFSDHMGLTFQGGLNPFTATNSLENDKFEILE